MWSVGRLCMCSGIGGGVGVGVVVVLAGRALLASLPILLKLWWTICRPLLIMWVL